ncbi:MAG: MerR family transcriptional regulator [Actinobacteria bacterium]|nr:MerR family transcriptional regulator [Actinomycetota bacterium]
MNELLTIGQFSRVCWLSIKALRLYAETGLLHPAYVDPTTNYRYYAPDQAPVARAIAILRTLDMPLIDIRELVTESDADKVRARLDAHRAVLEENVRRDEQKLKRVENFIKKGAVMTYDINIKEVEPADVIGLTLETSPEGISTDAGATYERLYDVLGQEGITAAGPPRLVYHRMDDDSWTIECCAPIAEASKAPEGFVLRSFPGGRAAHALHVGPYDELGMAYREMGVWIDKQGLSTANPPYDVYLNDPSEVKDPAKFETEIVWPVK